MCLIVVYWCNTKKKKKLGSTNWDFWIFDWTEGLHVYSLKNAS